MNEKFILNVFDKFEKSSAVLLHIKEGEAELTLKKEAAYQNVQAAVPFAVQNTPMQPVAGVDTNGYAAAGTMSANMRCREPVYKAVLQMAVRLPERVCKNTQ